MRTWYSGITVITLLVICAVSLAPLSTAQASGNFAIQVSPSTNRCGNVAADGITNSLILNCYESTPWGGDFVQSMEPVHDYCGPTAGMNLMRWYQHLPSIDTDTSYAQLGSLMRTNSWDPALMEVECNLACGLMPLACPACPSVPLLAVVGTLPRNMESALRTLQPPGFVFNRHDGPMDLATLQALLANGSPVVILGSEGATNLHWAMLTGIYLEGGVTKVRLANEPNVTTWDEFIAFWSLANLGGGTKAVLDLLDLGMNPYVAMWYSGPPAIQAPTNVHAVTQTHQAFVSFDPPVQGNSQVTGYTVWPNYYASTDADAGSLSLSHHVTGMVDFAPSYFFTVSANTSAGPGPVSAISNVVGSTTSAGPPPSNPVATLAGCGASVTFDYPVDDLTGMYPHYRYTASDYASGATTSGFDRPLNFRYLRPDSYDFGVSSANANGASIRVYANSITVPFLLNCNAEFMTMTKQLRRIDRFGPFAGTGTPGFSGDGNAAALATLNAPSGIATDNAGNFYLADTANHAVRKVSTATGTITTVTGDGLAGFTGDGKAAPGAELNTPSRVVVDGAGNLYIADTGNNAIRVVSGVTGNIGTLGASSLQSLTQAQAGAISLNAPKGLALDSAGNLYIADTGNHRILLVPQGTSNFTLVAGSGSPGYSGDGGPAGQATFNAPSGLAVDGAGNLYIADSGNHAVRVISKTGTVATLVGGTGKPGYSGDGGLATAATLNNPLGVTVDGSGNLFIADSGNSCIREVVTGDGKQYIMTVAGTGSAGFSGENGPAGAANLNLAGDVALDTLGNLYIADTHNNMVRTVTSVPNEPTDASAVTGDGRATVSFDTPFITGSSAIASYLVTANPGGITASGAASPITVTGLTNGVAYTFTVVANNATGAGPASEPSIPATPFAMVGGSLTAPGAPGNPSAIAGNGSASVQFSPPADSGGNPITSYTVTSNPGNRNASGAGSPITVTGLTSGVSYSFTVAATNTIGTGPASGPSNAVTPFAAAPGAPKPVAAVAGNGKATVYFSAPASDGGSTITSYAVKSSPGGISASGTGSPVTVNGLSNGTPYSFTITATNAVGTGPASAASNSVTPVNALYTLALTFAGAPGGGSVNGGMSCASGSTCPPATFDPGSFVKLTASPDANSLFGGWTGCTSASGTTCSVALNGNASVTAAFSAVPRLRILSAGSYGLFADAYAAAANNAVIQARGVEFNDGDWILSRSASPLNIYLVGGFDTLFSARPGVAIQKGRVLLRSGTLRVDGLAVR